MKRIAAALLAGIIAVNAPAAAGGASGTLTSSIPGGWWGAQGPGPALDGQVENVFPDGEVVGAVHALAPHPADPDVLYVGTVNGGIWKTMNATATSPNWIRQTDAFGSLSIGALELDPTDPSHETLVAGIGRYSSYIREGGDRIGLLRTVDGGANWTVLDGGGTLVGANISGVAPRGSTLVVSVNTADAFLYSNIGVFRSTDGGNAFTQISGGTGAATGLPGGVTHDLAGDPSNDARLFTSVIFAGAVGGSNGVYRSDDTGASWTKVSDVAMDALIDDSVTNIEIAVGMNDNVYVGIVGSGRLSGVFRSGDGGANWTAMDLPETVEGGVLIGIHPGGQGAIHFSILADPLDPDIVYIGGDRQPCFNESTDCTPTAFPNSIGADDYSGRLFRGDASQPSGQQWTPLTHVGTASNSSPHADSRDMAFDAEGDLIQVDDGGVYRRTSPRTAAGDWFSINGDLQATEYHGIAYDAVSGIVIGGAQDTGTTEQIVPDGATFRSVSTADGGDVAVDDHSTPGLSTRYSSFQNLVRFWRREFDSANVLQSDVEPALTLLGGGAALVPQFYTPVAVNAVDGDRLIFGAANSVYESLDQGDTISEIGPGIVINARTGDPIIYGVPGNADLLYVADGSTIRRRDTLGGALTPVNSPTGSMVNDLAIDPAAPARIFAVDTAAVFFSDSAGSSWTNVTGNLAALDPGRLRALAFVPGTDDALVVGADRGVFAALDSDGFADWSAVAPNLPNAPVYELDYNAAADVLLAGLLGRGAWKLYSGPPQVSVNPEPLDWGLQPAGALVTLPLVLSNTGDAPLTVQSLDATSPPFSGPLIDPSASPACAGGFPWTLMPGDDCTLHFTFFNPFSPPIYGVVEQFLEVVSDDPASPGQIWLRAEGETPQLAISPQTVDFGVQRIGQVHGPLAVTLESTGTAPVELAIVEDPLSPFDFSGGTCPTPPGNWPFDLAPGASCTLEYTFAPFGDGGATHQVSVVHDGAPGSDTSFTLQGVGEHAVIEIDPAVFNFGQVAVGNSASATMEVTNAGSNYIITVSGPDASGGLWPEVTVAPGTCTVFPFSLSPGQSCELELTFAPTMPYVFGENIELDHDASDGAWTYFIQGQSIDGPLLSVTPAVLDFGAQGVGMVSAPHTVILGNTGNAALDVLSVSAPVAPFSEAGGSCLPLPAALDPGDDCTLEYTFEPAAAGTFAHPMAVGSSGGDRGFELRGTGIFVTIFEDRFQTP